MPLNFLFSFSVKKVTNKFSDAVEESFREFHWFGSRGGNTSHLLQWVILSCPSDDRVLGISTSGFLTLLSWQSGFGVLDKKKGHFGENLSRLNLSPPRASHLSQQCLIKNWRASSMILHSIQRSYGNGSLILWSDHCLLILTSNKASLRFLPVLKLNMHTSLMFGTVRINHGLNFVKTFSEGEIVEWVARSSSLAFDSPLSLF